jgi:hypothetical protein
MYERLSESHRHNQADLVIKTNEFTIITEQKFSMLNISLLDTAFELDKADIWLTQYIHAVKQLENTAKNISHDSRCVIKLILFFDNVYIADGLVKERVVSLYKDSTAEGIDLKNVFMIDIEDYEILISLIASNQDLFNKVMRTKIERESNKDYSKGTEFNQLFQEYGIMANEYIEMKQTIGLDKTDL